MTMSATAAKADLDQFEWNKRVLVIYTPSVGNSHYHKQIDMFQSERENVQERDLVRVDMVGEHDKVLIYKQAGEPLDYNKLVSDLDINESVFQVLLIGKDGGIKARWDESVPMLDIFQLIDSMPMRQREMNDDMSSSKIQ